MYGFPSIDSFHQLLCIKSFHKSANMTTYGYARVSTNGQDLAAQEAELMTAGCAKVFKEKVSGAKNRPRRAGQAYSTPRTRRCGNGHAPRPLGTLNTGSAQYHGHH